MSYQNQSLNLNLEKKSNLKLPGVLEESGKSQTQTQHNTVHSCTVTALQKTMRVTTLSDYPHHIFYMWCG